MKFGIYNHYWRLRDFLDAEKKGYNIVASSDGKLYELRQTALGLISVPASEKALRRLDDVPKGFQFNLPKIPGEVMETIVSFFRSYCNPCVTSEVMLQVFWHKGEEYYFTRCPKQLVSKVSVDADLTYTNDEVIEVMQIHSHNSMRAYFSETDNKDEQRFLLYGVVGNLDEQIPEIVLRTGVNGHYYELPIEHIFEPFDLTKNVSYPAEFDKKVDFNNV